MYFFLYPWGMLFLLACLYNVCDGVCSVVNLGVGVDVKIC